MSLLAPVGGLVWEIVSSVVVTYAVPWLYEFVLQRILPLWQRYWPVIYQSVLVPAYHHVSDTIQSLLHDLRSNHGDSSAVSASESPPGGTSNVVPWLSEFVSQKIHPLWQRYWPVIYQSILVIYQSILVPAYHLIPDTIQHGGTWADHAGREADEMDPQFQKLILEEAAPRARRARRATRAPAGGTLVVAADMEADEMNPQVQQLILEEAAPRARRARRATRAPAGGTLVVAADMEADEMNPQVQQLILGAGFI